MIPTPAPPCHSNDRGSGREEDVGDVAPPCDATELNINADDRTHIVNHVVAAKPCTSLQDQEGNLLDRALRAVGVDRGHGTGMSGVDRAQESVRLLSAKFAEHDAIGAHP